MFNFDKGSSSTFMELPMLGATSTIWGYCDSLGVFIQGGIFQCKFNPHRYTLAYCNKYWMLFLRVFPNTYVSYFFVCCKFNKMYTFELQIRFINNISIVDYIGKMERCAYVYVDWSFINAKNAKSLLNAKIRRISTRLNHFSKIRKVLPHELFVQRICKKMHFYLGHTRPQVNI